MAGRTFSAQTTALQHKVAHELSIATFALLIIASVIWRIETTGFVLCGAVVLQYRYDLSIAALWTTGTLGPSLLRGWDEALPTGIVWLGLFLLSLSAILTRLRLGTSHVVLGVYFWVTGLCIALSQSIAWPVTLWLVNFFLVAPIVCKQWQALREPRCSQVPS